MKNETQMDFEKVTAVSYWTKKNFILSGENVYGSASYDAEKVHPESLISFHFSDDEILSED